MAALKIEDFQNHPFVKETKWGDLSIFGYTRECQYDRKWDDVTRAARGIIFNNKTGELVSLPFKKFFNLGEEPETYIQNLPDEPFTVTSKKDGSLGILHRHNGDWYVATKGSFQSEMAVWATKWMRENASLSSVKPGYTYLFEIIYPENRIVVDYQGKEACVLLGVINNETGQEMSYDALVEEANNLNVEVTEAKEFESVESIKEYCESLPASEEGFVVTFKSGLKVKIKGDEYCRIHRIISNMTPLAFWEAWSEKEMAVPKSFLAQIPEEFRELSDRIALAIDSKFIDLHIGIQEEYNRALAKVGSKDPKAMALYAKAHCPKYLSFFMHQYNNKMSKYWYLLRKTVRPTGNVIEGLNNDRLKRIQEDS